MLKRKTVGVLGLGIFGRTVARELSNYDQDVIAIDIRESHVKEIADLATKAAVGDITDKDFLIAVGVEQCDTVVIASGNNLESSVLAVMHCKKLGVRSEEHTSELQSRQYLVCRLLLEKKT